MATFNLISDFNGEFSVSQSKYGTTDLNLIIADTEEKILNELLGEDLRMKFITDLASVTPSTKYLNLRDGVVYSVSNKDGIAVNVNYLGIKKMLKCFTYAEIMKFQMYQNTEVGQTEPQQQNSSKLSKQNLSNLIEKYYNKGVNLYGYDIENYNNDETIKITNTYNNTSVNYDLCCETKQKYDYWKELIKGSCYNFLYKNNLDYPTWHFVKKEQTFLNGYL